MHSQIICRVATCASNAASMRAIIRMPIDVSMSTHAMIDWFAYGWNLQMSAHVTMNSTAMTPMSTSAVIGGCPSVRANIWKTPMAVMTNAKRICNR